MKKIYGVILVACLMAAWISCLNAGPMSVRMEKADGITSFKEWKQTNLADWTVWKTYDDTLQTAKTQAVDQVMDWASWRSYEKARLIDEIQYVKMTRKYLAWLKSQVADTEE
jgi:hypothetical protein